jgi:hypothetical protein
MRKIAFVISLAIFCGFLSRQREVQLSHDSLFSNWQYSDVRLIDPIDTNKPYQDVVAVLSRHDRSLLQVRVDFLDLKIDRGFDLYLLIDNQPDGNQDREFNNPLTDGTIWDITVKYTNSNLISIVDSDRIEIHNTKLRVTTDVDQDSIVMSIGVINTAFITSNSRVAIAVTLPNSTRIIDQTKSITLSTLAPSPINTAFIFWNVIDGSTPATLLRSWAGAHSGPQSTRHGLSYLLEAAQSCEIPINICDLNDPDISSALVYINAWEYIDLLIAGGVVYPVGECAINYAQYISTDNSLENNELYSTLVMDLINHYHSNPFKSIWIGHDLSKSNLGSRNVINHLFAYINSHPWIRVIGMPDLPSSGAFNSHLLTGVAIDSQSISYTTTGVPIPSGITVTDLHNIIAAELLHIPRNDISEYAAFIFDNLMETGQANVAIARGNYLSLIGHFLSAAFWAENPQAYNNCELDIDWDGLPECILATEKIFATFELDGGYLAYVFVNNTTGVHQVIGSTMQYGVLRSDPSLLVPERGLMGDPNQIPGAFSDSISNWRSYHGSAHLNQVVLISQDGYTNKSFTIDENIIRIRIDDRIQAIQMAIPVVLDPWLRYKGVWANIYWESIESAHWSWGAGDLISISITSSSDYRSYTFNDTHLALLLPEDPNFNYTSGHLLPLTMAMLEFTYQPLVTVDIAIDP